MKYPTQDEIANMRAKYEAVVAAYQEFDENLGKIKGKPDLPPCPLCGKPPVCAREPGDYWCATDTDVCALSLHEFTHAEWQTLATLSLPFDMSTIEFEPLSDIDLECLCSNASTGKQIWTIKALDELTFRRKKDAEHAPLS